MQCHVWRQAHSSSKFERAGHVHTDEAHMGSAPVHHSFTSLPSSLLSLLLLLLLLLINNKPPTNERGVPAVSYKLAG